jgi:hypothetical protein
MDNQEIHSILKGRLQLLHEDPHKDVEALTEGLETLRHIQGDVSLPVPGCIPAAGSLPTKEAVCEYTLAMIVEITELLQTTDWKPWKTKTVIDHDKVIDEFADVLAFQGILIYYLNAMGISPEQLAEGYRRKSIINIQRFMGQHSREYQQVLFTEEELK